MEEWYGAWVIVCGAVYVVNEIFDALRRAGIMPNWGRGVGWLESGLCLIIVRCLVVVLAPQELKQVHGDEEATLAELSVSSAHVINLENQVHTPHTTHHATTPPKPPQHSTIARTVHRSTALHNSLHTTYHTPHHHTKSPPHTTYLISTPHHQHIAYHIPQARHLKLDKTTSHVA